MQKVQILPQPKFGFSEISAKVRDSMTHDIHNFEKYLDLSSGDHRRPWEVFQVFHCFNVQFFPMGGGDVVEIMAMYLQNKYTNKLG